MLLLIPAEKNLKLLGMPKEDNNQEQNGEMLEWHEAKGKLKCWEVKGKAINILRKRSS